MVRATVIYCDRCSDEGVETPATERRPSFEDSLPQVIALCEAHMREYVTPLEELLAQHGVAPEDAEPIKSVLPQPRLGRDDDPVHPNGATEFKCNYPGCDKEYDPSFSERPAQALAMHRFRAHGIKGESIRSRRNHAAAGK